jgi:hypothetical protein
VGADAQGDGIEWSTPMLTTGGAAAAGAVAWSTTATGSSTIPVRAARPRDQYSRFFMWPPVSKTVPMSVSGPSFACQR